jgi:hypothetical protein
LTSPQIAPEEMVVMDYVKICRQASRNRGAIAALADAAEPAS